MEEQTNTRGRRKKNVSEDAGIDYEVIVELARVRKEMHLLGLIEKELKKGEIIKVIEKNDKWAKTKDGFIMLKHLNKKNYYKQNAQKPISNEDEQTK